MEKEKFTIPTEVVDLPSKGLFYPEDSLLRKGTIEIKYPTAKEEDILTSQNLIKKGIVIEEFLKSLIVDKSINYGDILIGDINAIMVGARILAYGPIYQAEVACPSCGNKQQIQTNLSEIEDKKTDDVLHDGNEFYFTMPVSKVKVGFKLLTQNDSKQAETINKKLKAKLGIDSELTSRLKASIISVNEDDTPKTINEFVDSMPARDSLAFRKHLNKITPDIDLSLYFECDECGHEGRVNLPLGTSFFWPSTEE